VTTPLGPPAPRSKRGDSIGPDGDEPLGKAARHHAVVARAARALADAMTRERVFQCIADMLRSEFQADGFAIYDADPRLRIIRLDYQAGAGRVDETRVASLFFQSILGDTVSSTTPRFLGDLTGDRGSVHAGIAPGTFATDVGAAALLPLVLDGEPRGLLTVRYVAPQPFDEHERHLLQSVATQVAIAYRNLRHVAELQRRAERLGAMTRAMQQLSHVASEDALPTAIAEAIQSVIPQATCDVLATTPTGLSRVLRANAGVRQGDAPEMTDLELAVARETLRTGISRLAVHLLPCGARPARSVELCAAVRYGSRTAGVLRLTAEESDAFDLQDLDLLSILARQAGSALETSRLFTLQEFQRQRAEGAAELARVTLHARNTAEGATELLRVLDRFVPSIGKAIAVARGRDGSIEYVATSGMLDMLQGRRVSGPHGLHGLAPDGRPRELVSLRELAAADDGSVMPDEWGFLVPLAARSRQLGALLVATPRSAPLARRDRVTLDRLSTSLALAVEALLLDEDERQGREREHLLATALTTIDHPIFILDRVGVRYANPAAAREYGWAQVELMDMHFDDLVVGVDPQRGRRVSDGFVETGMSLVQHVHRRRDGTEFPATVTVSPLLAQEGDVLGQVVSVRNVTADRRLEEQLRQTEKMIAVGELVAGVAHEINNPLTGISAFAQMLLEDALSETQKESVQLIKQESDRAKDVIRDLLLFARKHEPRIVSVALGELIEQTLRLRAYSLRHAGIRVQHVNDGNPTHVSGDRQKLQQVFLNLISNAEHAMEASAVRTLTVQTTTSPDLVQVAVTDTGRGMPPEVRRRAFEPFFSGTPNGTGTGLGLSVSYGIVQAHGGTIDVQSQPGVGTTVVVSLPATGAVPSHPAADADPSITTPDRTPDRPVSR
jgi:two-component system, NtrC family, sensor kinase